MDIVHTFTADIGKSIANTFFMKYRYWYWLYFQKVLFTTLLVLAFIDICGNQTDIPQIGCNLAGARLGWICLNDRILDLP